MGKYCAHYLHSIENCYIIAVFTILHSLYEVKSICMIMCVHCDSKLIFYYLREIYMNFLFVNLHQRMQNKSEILALSLLLAVAVKMRYFKQRTLNFFLINKNII
ncbi:Protein of unknown function [Gryllus bimaculatus]|nr:Protein of unknown function [Gryllus bimaculatus]